MQELMFALIYATIGIGLVSADQAVFVAFIAGVCAFGVRKLTRAARFKYAFRWFIKYPFMGLGTVALVSASIYFGWSRTTDQTLVLFSAPLVFLWAWLFMALSTFIDEWRVSKLVAKVLREREKDQTIDSNDRT